MLPIIIGNFGNHSLAVMQALLEKQHANIHFIYVETGWEASTWPDRIDACSQYARNQGVTVHILKAPATFAKLVEDRNQFPSRKFQWCAGFLKGLAIISHLDELDPQAEATIVSGKRRLDSRRYAHLEEFETEELYQGRSLWHPLWSTANEAFSQLIHRAGFVPLSHRSLECCPCIHTNSTELNSIDPPSLERLVQLEDQLHKTMFSESITTLSFPEKTSVKQASGFTLDEFDLGCGAPWGCGE